MITMKMIMSGMTTTDCNIIIIFLNPRYILSRGGLKITEKYENR